MGHYSDDYEHEEDLKRKERDQDLKKLLRKVESLMKDPNMQDVPPERFRSSLEDLRNWLVYTIRA